ncbi:TLD-domain-containing protein, partial [Gorgonomyces haynaldii]
LLVIETMNGNKFGGFNSQPFKKSPKFTGDKNCFIFQLDPFQVFYPTNINQNYVYFQHSSKTLLNGIGFGGQMDFFCFFFDPDFKGHCRGQTTFDNPIFEPEFQVKDLEIWMTEERDQEEIDRHQDKREAMALLEMAGKTMYSKDV